MSLIITYVGRSGCVMAGDKRRIGFLGDPENREVLEKELYTGKIKTDDDLLKRAEELQVTLNIRDDAQKVRKLGEVLVGEVRHAATDKTLRKRLYATSRLYNLVHLEGSHIKNIESGESRIIVFGNTITKKISQKLIKEKLKSKVTLEGLEDIFRSILEETAKVTPSISKEYDIYLVRPKIDKREARKLLRETILQDVKDLKRWRQQLREHQLETQHKIRMANQIINQGRIGVIKDVQNEKIRVKLFPGVEARDIEWELSAGPGEEVEMELEDPSVPVLIEDRVVIEDENLCVERTKTRLICDLILCKTGEEGR